MEAQLRLRAISPDNERDLRSICALYSKSYGENFPVKSVYQLGFWKNHIGRRFISVAASLGEEMLGHVALSPDPHDSRHVQLCYPVCQGDQFVEPFCAELQALLRSVSRGRGWSIASLAAFVPVAGMQRFFDALPGSCQGAILPCYPAAEDFAPVQDLLYSPESSSVEIWPRHVILGVAPLNGEAGSTGTVYLPSSHASMAGMLLNKFALAVSSQEESELPDFVLKESFSDPVTREFYPLSGVCHQFVRPSRMPSVSQLVAEVSGPQVRASYIYVDARDPRCPAFCYALEKHDFSFCGMVPALRGTDHAVYCRTCAIQSLDLEAFEAAPARLLCKYLKASATEDAVFAQEVRLSA